MTCGRPTGWASHSGGILASDVRCSWYGAAGAHSLRPGGGARPARPAHKALVGLRAVTAAAGHGDRQGSARNVAPSLTQMKGHRTRQRAKKDPERQGERTSLCGPSASSAIGGPGAGLDMATSGLDGAHPHSHVLHHTPPPLDGHPTTARGLVKAHHWAQARGPTREVRAGLQLRAPPDLQVRPGQLFYLCHLA